MFFNTEEHTEDPKNQINKDISQFMVAFEQVILCESNGSKKKKKCLRDFSYWSNNFFDIGNKQDNNDVMLNILIIN